MLRKTAISLGMMAGLLLAPAAVRAVPIPISGTDALGAFTGTFEYTPVDATSGIVEILLNNTSPPDNGGFLTALAFNIPDGATVTGATVDSSINTFEVVLGGPGFSNSVNASPYGHFDIGAGVGSPWEGGGPPANGIPVSSFATFTFNLTGTGLGSLTTANFLSTLSDVGTSGQTPEEFITRFRGFEDGGSDKVPNGPGTPVPGPGTLALVGLGLASLSARRLASRTH
jgi:hypothetical protein